MNLGYGNADIGEAIKVQAGAVYAFIGPAFAGRGSGRDAGQD